MEFSRPVEWVAFPSPGDLPNPGIKPTSPALQADSLPVEPQEEKGIFIILAESNTRPQVNQYMYYQNKASKEFWG